MEGIFYLGSFCWQWFLWGPWNCISNSKCKWSHNWYRSW